MKSQFVFSLRATNYLLEIGTKHFSSQWKNSITQIIKYCGLMIIPLTTQHTKFMSIFGKRI